MTTEQNSTTVTLTSQTNEKVTGDPIILNIIKITITCMVPNKKRISWLNWNNDWIGLYRVSEKDNRNYMSYTSIINTGDFFNVDLSIPMYLKGTFEVRYFKVGSYEYCAKSNPFVI